MLGLREKLPKWHAPMIRLMKYGFGNYLLLSLKWNKKNKKGSRQKCLSNGDRHSAASSSFSSIMMLNKSLKCWTKIVGRTVKKIPQPFSVHSLHLNIPKWAMNQWSQKELYFLQQPSEPFSRCQGANEASPRWSKC